MATYMVDYDLRQPGRQYEELIDRLHQLGGLSPLKSTWVVKGNFTAMQLLEDLMQYIDANDGLLVLEVTGQAAWYGIEAQDALWLKTNL